MDGGRRLGWIAIAIGVLALFVALGGRGREARFGGWHGQDHGESGYGRSWEGPRGGFVPDNSQVAPGPRGDFGPRDGFGGRGGFGPGHGHGPFFLAPFFFLAGLLRIAGIVALVIIGLRLLKRNRNRGGPHGPNGPHNPQGPSETQARPGPEGYTGETTNL